MLLFALALAAPFDVGADYSKLAAVHCRAEWPNDFRMQAYCMKQQRIGMLQFKAVIDELGEPIEKALEKCTEEWTNDRVPDWQMIGYCATVQAKAFKQD